MRKFGYELRASAAPGCGLRRPFGRKFKIQDSKFRIKQGYRIHLDIHPVSGRSLRSTPATIRSCGPPPPGGCGPPIPAGSISLAGSPWHCFGSSGRQPAAADFRRDILQQTRLRSSRQPAAAPGRRAAFSRPAGPLMQAHPLGCGLVLRQKSTALEAEPSPARSYRTEPQHETSPLRSAAG